MNESNRNMIIAIVLSVVVLLGWQFFIAGPQLQKQQQQAALEQQQASAANPGLATASSTAPGHTATPAANGATAPAAAPAAIIDRAQAIAATQRVAIDTPSVKGSINLTGGRLDDLELKKYTETVDPSSPIITLLSPSGVETPQGMPYAYYVEQGWVPASGSTAKVPDAQTVWTADGGTATLTPQTPVTLTWDNGAGLVFHRTFAVDTNYLFTVTQTVDNKTGADVQLFPYSRAVREGTPKVQNFFVQHEGPVGVLGSNNEVSKKYSDVQSDKQERWDNTTGWIGYTDKYWATVVIANPGEQINAQFTYLKPGNVEQYQSSFVTSTPVTIAANASASDKSFVFAGAKEESVLSSYEQTQHIDRLDLLIDWGWFFFFTRPMFYLLKFLYGFLGNFGLAMLSMTVIVKLLFFPLANRSYASMAAMRRVQPEMKQIQARFKDDRPAQQQAMMELYKREKINPLSGCWPILLQIPVFYSLYTVIFISLEMRHAPFFGWIQDLAAQDPTNIFTLFGLINWDPTQLPFVGGFAHLGVWPLIMGCTMWVQMRLNPQQGDATQQAILNWMPVIFTFTLGTFPAGLVIYWSWNNTLSICQQYFIMSRHGAKVDLFGNILTSLGLRKPKTTT
ncbi:MAG TPA: membrane protein insertase YidC [Devosia sp.]|jgi:YidC/Oxa1 family membrane protein insertase|nr:membrane protein insertase YidC [Devosia sp.]